MMTLSHFLSIHSLHACGVLMILANEKKSWLAKESLNFILVPVIQYLFVALYKGMEGVHALTNQPYQETTTLQSVVIGTFQPMSPIKSTPSIRPES